MDQVVHQLLQLGPGQRHLQVLGAAGVGGDKGQVDLGLHGRRQLDLGLFGGLLEALQAIRSSRRSMPCSFLNSSATQLMTRWSKSSPPRKVSPLVERTSKHLVAHVQDGDVKGAAAQVIDGDPLLDALAQAVGQR